MPPARAGMGEGTSARRIFTFGGWTALLLLFCAHILTALDPRKAIKQYGLDVWTRKDGLPLSSVSAILQTQGGYRWLGTMEGLERPGGSLTVTSEPGRGTLVSFRVPLKQHEHALPRAREHS
ncbi:MAG: hypothetical protein AB1714_08100 [Acidobacteriota bacterium]